MGGIHATMRMDEALEQVDAIVTGEAEGIWPQVLQDVQRDTLKPHYMGSQVEADSIPIARHELLPSGYYFGSIQTARGCPLNCSFCSVTTFSGRALRRRPVDEIIEEFRQIRESPRIRGGRQSRRHAQGPNRRHQGAVSRHDSRRPRKEMDCPGHDQHGGRRRTASARRGRRCSGIFVGFESTTAEGLAEIHKKFNIQKGRDFQPPFEEYSGTAYR